MLIENKNGFTIIEVLVVLFIVGLLSAVTLANYRQGEDDYVLLGEAQRLASKMRMARNMAMSGTGIASGKYGYGLHFSRANKTSYIFFVDKNGNKKYDNGEEFEVIKLPDNVRIVTISQSISGIFDLFFEPPKPTVYFQGYNNPRNSNFWVKLGTVDGSSTKDVSISMIGWISVD